MADVLPNRLVLQGERERSTRKPIAGRWLGWWHLLPLLPVGVLAGAALMVPAMGLDPTSQDLLHRLQPPVGFGGSWDHPLGTDSLGRDVLARVLTGARLSLAIGLLAATVATVIGVALGLAAATLGRVADDFVTALVEMVLAIPTIVVGLVVAATLGQGLVNLVAILVLSGWVIQARVLRLQARRVMRSEFVLAAWSMGAGRLHVATRHVLPNVLPQVLVVFCQQVAAIMIWEASLTYLGIGLPIERISLGGLIRDGQQHLFDAPWLGIFPGIVLAWAVIGFSLQAGWLQAWLAPGSQHRRRRTTGGEQRFDSHEDEIR